MGKDEGGFCWASLQPFVIPALAGIQAGGVAFRRKWGIKRDSRLLGARQSWQISGYPPLRE